MQKTPVDANDGRVLADERKVQIVRDVQRKDHTGPDVYLVNLRSRDGLKKMIEKQRPPYFVFFDDTAHIIFPPSPIFTRRNNRMLVSSYRYAWETPEYVFHSSQYKGPKTACSYAEIPLDEAVNYCKELVAQYTAKGDIVMAKVYSDCLAKIGK